MARKPTFEQQMLRAQAAYEAALASPFRVMSARYLDPPADRLLFFLQNGVELSIPRGLLEELAGAPLSALRAVSVDYDGICFEEIDVAIDQQGLLADMVGARDARLFGRQGGSARSEAKQRAARENGRKGGRPRKAAR
ncbi:MAG: DUF2442 domain-containing protein [Candidatus Sericytochromatia bacterium]|nr:DUF2442 domain-containing protein [Candidatus Tanganyikabacteria bacterium]